MTSSTTKRVFGTVHPESGIDWQFFESTAKKEGLKLGRPNVVYTVPLDTSQTSAKNQEEAPTIVAKLKDAGVTTVMLFTSFQMNQALLKAADELDYHPEWVFTGMGAQDIEITARILNGIAPEQMKHVFGLGNLPLYVDGHQRPAAGLVQLVLGRQPGRLLGGHRSARSTSSTAALSFAGPEAHAEDVPAGDVQHAAAAAAPRASSSQSFMTGLGPTPGLPYDVYSQVGLDYAIMWWNPDRRRARARSSSTRAPAASVHRRREALRGGRQGRRVEAGRAEAVRPANSISQFDELPASDVGPDFPCKGCPSARPERTSRADGTVSRRCGATTSAGASPRRRRCCVGGVERLIGEADGPRR